MSLKQNLKQNFRRLKFSLKDRLFPTGSLLKKFKKKFLKKYVFDAREGLVETLSPAEKTKLTDFIARTEDLAESLVPVIQGIYSIPGTTLKF